MLPQQLKIGDSAVGQIGCEGDADCELEGRECIRPMHRAAQRGVLFRFEVG